MIPPSYIFKAIHQQHLLDADPEAERLLPFEAPPRDGLAQVVQALVGGALAARGRRTPRPARA